ncbi:peptidylprolyl isomerase [bacterium]|nr:peptidylprolyl isomerase [bacterium]
MMQALRDKMKYVMMIVAAGFLVTIVMSWGAGGFKNSGKVERGIIGVVNGQKIKYQYFSQLLAQQMESYSRSYPDREFPEYQKATIRNQLWNGIVAEIVKAEAISEMNLGASAEEIMYQLRNNPPAYLRQTEQFQTDGKFDMAKYQQALNDPQNFRNWVPVENQLRQVIPAQKLRAHITAHIRVSDAEIHEAYRLENEKVKARLVFFDPNKESMENIIVSDNDISNYYNEHKEDYRQPEQRKIEYLKNEVLPSPEDTLQVYEDAKYIMERLEDGDSFADLARDFSKDPGTKDNDGDLGFFEKDGMETPFTEAAFATRPGKITGPIETIHGLHIIKVLGKKREDGQQKVHAQHILLKYEVSSQTRDAILDRAQYIYDELQKDEELDFKSFASEEGQTIVESPLFRKGSFIPGIGMATRVVNVAFREKTDYVSPPIYAGENLIVFRLAEIQKTQIRPQDEVHQSIQRILQREQKLEKAAATCTQFASTLNSSSSLDAATLRDSMEIIEAGYFTLQGNIPKVGKNAKVNGTAFTLNVGEISNPVHTDRGSYIIQVVDKHLIDENLFQTERLGRHQQLLTQKQNTAWSEWLTALIAKADVKDYREYYY